MREEASEFRRQVEERIAKIPKDFLDWMGRMPPWPEDADEIIGPGVPPMDREHPSLPDKGEKHE